MTSVGITPEFEEKAQGFYKEVLFKMVESHLPFMLGGTYAVKHYTGIDRPTKDLDFFCTAGDYPKILKFLAEGGYRVTIEDERWLARAYKDDMFVDVIFGSIPGVWPITQQWLNRSQEGEVLGFKVRITPPEELIVSKVFRMKRGEFDGGDVVHVILRQGRKLDWKHLVENMDTYWEVLFFYILLYRFIYPSEREQVPRWVLDTMNERLQLQMDLPTPQDKVSRGSLLSWEDYRVGVEQWGFKDMTEFTFSEKKK